MENKKSTYTVKISHKQRMCHPETCCCSGNYVVVENDVYVVFETDNLDLAYKTANSLNNDNK